MIWHRNAVPPTTAEQERIDRMLAEIGCVLTYIKFRVHAPAECHHITVGRKRLGHLYTIPLSCWYHRGVGEPKVPGKEMYQKYGASLVDGSRAFFRDHCLTEMDLWIATQDLLGLPATLPSTKVLPRRLL